MFDVATQRGASHVTVAHVTERSGVSRRTFYELFEDREDCFLAAFEQALEFASERVLSAYRSQESWRERIAAALSALLVFLDEEPVVGKLLIVESLSGGPRTLDRRNEAIAQITSAIDGGREEARAASPPRLTAEGIVGGALTVIHSRLGEADRRPLVQLLNQLMSMIVLPYLGATVARRELDRPAPKSRSPRDEREPLLSDPFKDAGMRLTYRTVRVLMAIVDRPGASNRMIGQSAGVSDQGQVSKLLSRLQRIGLAANTGLRPGQGAPNAWVLTDKGHQVVHTIRSHSKDSDPGGSER
ncbi:MAG TPA: TetR/AcrR family transcriptional regulator [Solirubrobacteraceae bacterium]|nr:TetR/AcrR family transcriptional regulator [Solirubrobacteraceae bacterium]